MAKGEELTGPVFKGKEGADHHDNGYDSDESALIVPRQAGESRSRPGGPYLWIIEAPYFFLDHFCLLAGLDRDSAVPLTFTLRQERFAEARLVYPGAKCDRPEAWVKVMALLHVHHIPFKLYQATGHEDRLTSLVLLKPAIDEELQTILGCAAGETIATLRRYGEMLNRVFSMLETFVAEVGTRAGAEDSEEQDEPPRKGR